MHLVDLTLLFVTEMMNPAPASVRWQELGRGPLDVRVKDVIQQRITPQPQPFYHTT